jgi:large conductance mechanosensitive channel
MGFLDEFKAFALKGNVVDMAIGVIIGGAFGKIVDVLVNKVMMPPIGFLTGGVDFSQKSLSLGNDPTGKAVVVGWGEWLNTIINFIIIAFVLFLVVKAMNNMKKKEPPPPPPAPGPSEQYLKEIRDLLAKR